jgi:hypothetical protein
MLINIKNKQKVSFKMKLTNSLVPHNLKSTEKQKKETLKTFPFIKNIKFRNFRNLPIQLTKNRSPETTNKKKIIETLETFLIKIIKFRNFRNLPYPIIQDIPTKKKRKER